MKDYLVKSVINDGMFRAYALTSTNLVREAQKRHDTWSAATAALGRSLTATIMLASSVLKGTEKMTVKINGGGPVGTIVVDGNANGTVKGYLQNPHVSLPLKDDHHIDVGQAVGNEGIMAVTKEMEYGDPFTGQVGLASGEIGDDFTYYLAQSEQIPSSVGVSVFVNPDESVDVAGGFLIQVMPDATDEAIDILQKNLEELPLVSEMLREGLSPEQMLERIFKNDDIKILDRMDAKFACDCSKERFTKALISLPKDDVQDMINEDHGAEAQCSFCGNKYQFSEEDLEEIIKQH
ncbi:Hsp33 family molecular chaperone HslO [Pediococcus claussenii]|uniref:33 kDa chaperonin n=1 Tax=Pediococcus claussenii (strain ATCC BAA-344 / DSM 14800 / JCM 18046 / KCTC 3811 / LMG 21948 / P06) TaxID=701521 RepID=G8PAN8_PEDCP|nr:Hsp33 family molecular chaperone HslO [Pediococcus claussenii]AEV94597.1 33 kDa chaperonin [Pediococcus claussenii ATCC BAA-344]ANZ69805.1 molecular chaperone Hsp33 [Pediococcus claussenii]ANZ71622.1 molecular chaperone Hsp33 [Pediococcus claussenii]KRN19697.1 hslO protein [Pediococcus claussenii]